MRSIPRRFAAGMVAGLAASAPSTERTSRPGKDSIAASTATTTTTRPTTVTITTTTSNTASSILTTTTHNIDAGSAGTRPTSVGTILTRQIAELEQSSLRVSASADDELQDLKRQDLYGAILSGDTAGVLKRMQAGESIFTRLPSGAYTAALPRRPTAGLTLLEFALDCGQLECAKLMLQQCAPGDALERDARLLDMLQNALPEGDWDLVQVLMALIGDLGIRLRHKNLDRVFQYLLRCGEMRLAGVALDIGAARPLTQKQLAYMTHDALRRGTRAVIETLFRRHPEVLSLAVCSAPRVVDHANGEAIAVLLQGGFVPQGLNGAQLASLLARLLHAAEESTACKLLSQFPQRELPCGALLQAAVRDGASRFLALFLQRLDRHDPHLEGALYEAMKTAVKLGYAAGIRLLAAHGVDLFRRPRTALNLLSKLVRKKQAHALVAGIESGQVSREAVFMRLIHHCKANTLAELQQHFGLSFCAGMGANLSFPEPGAACNATLLEINNQLRLAVRNLRTGPIKMMCALAQAGFCWASSHNLIGLRGRIVAAGLAAHGHYEQEFILAMAAHLARLGNSAQMDWPGPQQGPQSQILLAEQFALAVLGNKVLAHTGERLQGELVRKLKMSANAQPPLAERLQSTVGLPFKYARMAEAAWQQVLPVTGPLSQQGEASLSLVAHALRDRLQQAGKPALDPDDPISVWHCACWQILLDVSARLVG